VTKQRYEVAKCLPHKLLCLRHAREPLKQAAHRQVQRTWTILRQSKAHHVLHMTRGNNAYLFLGNRVHGRLPIRVERRSTTSPAH
jgi:hypothetical protein